MITFRPAIRQQTPLIIGLAGPTKAGKTYSAMRLATGLAHGGIIAMLNAEGARGHQYADTFRYQAADIVPPYRPTVYTEAVTAAAKLSPAVLIIDSVSHLHDGPGGMLDWHEEELERMAGADHAKRERVTFAAWVKPKQSENEFVYTLLSVPFAVILCMRAKDKIKIVKGKPPIDLGLQPIVSDRVSFETLFTLMLPPHSRGIPDLSISDMREPFDTLVPAGKPIDEALGKRLAEWATGNSTPTPTPTPTPVERPAGDTSLERRQRMLGKRITTLADGHGADWLRLLTAHAGAECAKLSEVAEVILDSIEPLSDADIRSIVGSNQ